MKGVLTWVTLSSLNGDPAIIFQMLSPFVSI